MLLLNFADNKKGTSSSRYEPKKTNCENLFRVTALQKNILEEYLRSYY
jgi:hypothetical protein